MPYGTPCSDNYDPQSQKLEILQCEVESLRKRIAELAAERAVQPEIRPAIGQGGEDDEPGTPGNRRSRTRA